VEQIEFLSDDYMSYVDRLHAMLLGKSISILRSDNYWFGISDEKLSTLNHARDARNWIVHQSGLGVLFRNEELSAEQLILNITKVARGDFLVSRWSYEFYEKEAFNWIREQDYIDMIVKWVIGVI
jgi:hypothetical protein